VARFRHPAACSVVNTILPAAARPIEGATILPSRTPTPSPHPASPVLSSQTGWAPAPSRCRGLNRYDVLGPCTSMSEATRFAATARLSQMNTRARLGRRMQSRRFTRLLLSSRRLVFVPLPRPALGRWSIPRSILAVQTEPRDAGRTGLKLVFFCSSTTRTEKQDSKAWAAWWALTRESQAAGDLGAIRKQAAQRTWRPFVPCFRLLRPPTLTESGGAGDRLGPTFASKSWSGLEPDIPARSRSLPRSCLWQKR